MLDSLYFSFFPDSLLTIYINPTDASPLFSIFTAIILIWDLTIYLLKIIAIAKSLGFWPMCLQVLSLLIHAKYHSEIDLPKAYH